MNPSASDAFVFFGAMGDLAFKKIFPSLQAMVQRGTLNVPVIGVDRSAENLDELKARARSSLEKSGKFDAAAFEKLCSLLRYVRGDITDLPPFKLCARCLMVLKGPRFTWRFPRRSFRPSWSNWPRPAVPNGARIILEKPFGHDLLSAQQLNRVLFATFAKKRFTASIIIWASVRYITWCTSVLPMPFWKPSGIATILKACKSPWPRISACRVGADFTMRPAQCAMSSRITCSRCWPILPWNRRSGRIVNRFVTKRSKCSKPFSHYESQDLVRGQFRGYLDEKGVAPNSQIETFAAMRLEIDSWRWKGVPFYIRAGKSLPVTCTEIVARLRRPPTIFGNQPLSQNHVRIRINPDINIALGLNVMSPIAVGVGESVEILGSFLPPRRRDGCL